MTVLAAIFGAAGLIALVLLTAAVAASVWRDRGTGWTR